MKRSICRSLVLFLVLITLVRPADAFVGLIFNLANLVINTHAKARWSDLIEANPKLKEGDFRSAYELVRQGYESRLEGHPSATLDDVVRLKALSGYAPSAGRIRDFDDLLASQADRFEKNENPLILAYFQLLRATSANSMGRVRSGREYRNRAIALFRKLAANEVSDWGFFDKFGAGVSADLFSKQLEIDIYLHVANLLYVGAETARQEGQDLEALDLAKQSSEFIERYFAEVKRINEKFTPPPNGNRVAGFIPYYAYLSGIDKSPDDAIESLKKLRPLPGDSLAFLYLETGRFEDAEILMRSVSTTTEKQKTASPLGRFTNLSLLDQSLMAQGKFAEAEKELQDAIAGLGAATSDSPELASEGLALLNGLLTESRLKQSGKLAEAASSAQASVDAMKAHLARGERLMARRYYLKDARWKNILGAQAIALARGNAGDGRVFEAMQLAKNSQVAETLNEVAARLSLGSDDLSDLVRKAQDLKAEIKGLGTRMASVDAGSQATLLKDLREERGRLAAELVTVNAQIASNYPAYMELTQPAVTGVEEVQGLLGPNEALAAWTVGESESVLMIVRRDGVRNYLLPTGRDSLRALVKPLQMQLDPAAESLAPINARQAYDLYADWLLPGKEMLAGIKHLIVVTDDALGNLPLSVMLTAPPLKTGETLSTNAQFSTAPWLVRDYAISVLPGISSLKALRQVVKPTKAGKPFIGFGDPLFDDHPTLKGAATRSGRQHSSVGTFRSAVADSESLKSVPSLPETADELKSIASTLGADSSSVYLRERATETAVRTVPLTDYRVMSFATHGVVSGDVRGINEPGLLLSPPETPGPDDDGVLTASEVALLKLDADWVLLSACNTGASDGQPGSEGHSGLGKAFLYAGARSILLSHWSVPSESTALLTTRMLQTYSRSGATKAEAQREAMLSLIDGNRGKFAHPSYWAPFVILGDGAQSAREMGAVSSDAVPEAVEKDKRKDGPVTARQGNARRATAMSGK